MKPSGGLRVTAGIGVAEQVASPPWWVASAGTVTIEPAVIELGDAEALLASRVERNTRLGHFRIPQVPAVAAEAMGLLSHPDVDAAAVSSLIHKDQQLASDVVSFANSALFAGAGAVTNIPQAIVRVGFRRTRSLIFASCLRAVVYGGSELPRAERLWRHSIGCACIAARIAKNVGRDPDDLYLAGLFHDIGKAVVLALLDTLAVRSQHKILRSEFIDWTIQQHHERVGAELALQWNLPDEVIDCIQRHSESDDVPLTAAQAIIAIANNACHRLHVGSQDDGRAVAGPHALAALAITEADLPRVLDGVPDAIEEL